MPDTEIFTENEIEWLAVNQKKCIEQPYWFIPNGSDISAFRHLHPVWETQDGWECVLINDSMKNRYRIINRRRELGLEQS